MRKYGFICSLLLMAACKTEGVEKETDALVEQQVEQAVDTLEMDLKVLDEVKLDNGIVISWLKKGEGDLLKQGDVAMIDYKVRLEDSTIIDGNHLLNMSSFPFMVGFQMQTKGWDLTLMQLRVGDFVRVFIPSKLVRGKKGIKGLIPENADNYLTLRVLEKPKPIRQIDGNKVWLFEENPANKTKFGEDNTIVFHAMVSTPSTSRYFDSFQKNNPFELRLADNGVVPGLKKALINAKKGDRMFILVPASEAYGSKGYLDIVKPNEDLFYNVMVMDVLE